MRTTPIQHRLNANCESMISVTMHEVNAEKFRNDEYIYNQQLSAASVLQTVATVLSLDRLPASYGIRRLITVFTRACH
jgi:hypothetical protein